MNVLILRVTLNMQRINLQKVNGTIEEEQGCHSLDLNISYKNTENVAVGSEMSCGRFEPLEYKLVKEMNKRKNIGYYRAEIAMLVIPFL